jgi:hypothetical protein
MRSFLKTIAHAFVSAAVIGAASQLQNGGPVTSGNVLVPALIAGVLGAIHAMAPSTLDPSPSK